MHGDNYFRFVVGICKSYSILVVLILNLTISVHRALPSRHDLRPVWRLCPPLGLRCDDLLVNSVHIYRASWDVRQKSGGDRNFLHSSEAWGHGNGWWQSSLQVCTLFVRWKKPSMYDNALLLNVFFVEYLRSKDLSSKYPLPRGLGTLKHQNRLWKRNLNKNPTLYSLNSYLFKSNNLLPIYCNAASFAQANHSHS